MQHRDKVLLEKIISEIDIAARIMGTKGQAEFLADEILKRAIGMTVINITAHKYQTLRMEDVYMTVRKDFPKLRENLAMILGEG